MTLVNYAKAVASSVYIGTMGNRGMFKELKHKTAFVKEAVLPIDVCDALRARIDDLADQETHPRVWRDSAGSDTRIFCFEQDMTNLLSHFDVSSQIEAINAYTGTKTRSWFLMANRVLPKDNNLGSGGGMHRDSPFSHQVKCIWYLVDVTSKNGPFQYVPDTHNNLIKKRHDYPLGQMRFDRVEDEMIEVYAPAGSLLVCDTRCVHGGKPIKSDVRYAVTLYTDPHPKGAERTFRKLGLDPSFATAPGGA